MTNLTGLALLALFCAAIVTSCQEPRSFTGQAPASPPVLAFVD